MRWSRKVDFLEKWEKATGKRSPSLHDRPSLDPDLSLIWQIFSVANTARGHYVRPSRDGKSQLIASQPIAVGEVAALIDLAGVIDTDQKMRIVRLVSKMDAAFLNEANSKA